MDIDARIAYSVAIKEAGEFMRSEFWQDYVETDDLVGELFALTDLIFEGLEAKTGVTATPKSSGSKRSGRGSTSSSSRQDSNRGGSTNKPQGFKDGSADATPNQVKAIKKMLDNADISYDRNGVDFNGDEYTWNELTMDDAQVFFDELGNK